jgi:galactokinase
VNLKSDRARLLNLFEKQFGSGGTPQAALAPGRSNLIGEHTDYNGGLVLPIAVDRHTVVLFRAAKNSRDASRFKVYTDVFKRSDEFSIKNIERSKDEKLAWANYVRGTARALQNRGIKLKGGELYISGDLPRGAGLSSSASLETAAGLAMLALAGRKMNPQDLAFAAQEAEHRFALVMCGIMDQTVVGRAQNGHALLLDCNTIQVTQIPIALKGYSFAIFDTGVRHKLASSEYNKRRSECEHAAAVMKKKTLRDVSTDDLLRSAGRLTANEHKRVRHVLTENIRVIQFAAALSRGDVNQLGRLLLASHESLANDYEVSCRELDVVVSELMKKSARDGACAGARMTGGGFGGAVVALLKSSAFDSYAKHMKPYAKGGSLKLSPGGGARVEKL